MRAQVSLEYLLVFSVSISILLVVLPLVSEVEGVSREVVLKTRLDSLAKDVSSGCEELVSLGREQVFVTEVSFSVDIDTGSGSLVVSSNNLSSEVPWRESCRLNNYKFSSGDRVRVLRDLT